MSQDNEMPDDEKLSALYRQTVREQPPAHLDKTILAASRREVDSRPHPAYSPFSANWRIPASLAAVLVLSVSLVFLVEEELPQELAESDMASSQPNGIVPARPAITGQEPEPVASPAMKPASKPVPLARSRDDADRLTESLAGGRRDEAKIESQLSQATEARKKAKLQSRPEEYADSSGAEDVATEEGLLKKEDTRTTFNFALPSGASIVVPSVNDITRMRETGNIEQAKLAADQFILHHFGDDLDNITAEHIKLDTKEWHALITELRLLERKQDADRIEQLLVQKQEN